MSVESDKVIIKDAIKEFLQGKLELGLGVIGIGKAIKRQGVSKETLVVALSEWLEEGGEDTVNIMAQLVAGMGVGKVNQMNERIKEVEAEVVKTEGIKPDAPDPAAS